jgi:hypothetical protein
MGLTEFVDERTLYSLRFPFLIDFFLFPSSKCNYFCASIGYSYQCTPMFQMHCVCSFRDIFGVQEILIFIVPINIIR